MSKATSKPFNCLMIVTLQGLSMAPLNQGISALRHSSPCSSTSVIRVCKAPVEQQKDLQCTSSGGRTVCSKRSASAQAGCDIVLPDTGQECHSLLRAIWTYYHSFGEHGFSRLVNVPGTMLLRSDARRKRMLEIVQSLRRAPFYHDATDPGFKIRWNATYDKWKGKTLTPAQPQPIGAWIERWLNGSHVCRVYHSQGAFSVSAELIRRRPPEFYRSLLHQVESCNQCEVCHYLERLWHAVFLSPKNGHSSTCTDRMRR